MTDFAPTHPGEILLGEFLEPMGISQYRIAKAIDVLPWRINEIVPPQAGHQCRHRATAVPGAGSQRHVLHQHAGALRRRSGPRTTSERTSHYPTDCFKHRASPERDPGAPADLV